MSVETINLVHLHAEPTYTEQLGMELESIIDELGPIEGCTDYFVVRCRQDSSTWIVSSHWQTQKAMETHFQESSVSAFIELLSSCQVRRIQINTFLNQHALCT
jgi:quinol monooxygenase YgiN